jgi:hypothetical protein
MTFCIPKEINKKIIEQIESGQLSIQSMLDADYDKLDNIIRNVVGDEYSAEIAERFVKRFKTQLSKEDTINISKIFAKIEELKLKERNNGIDVYVNPNSNEIKDWARLQIELDDYLKNIVMPNEGLSLPKSVKKFFTDELQKITDQDTLFKKIMAGGKSLINVLTAPIYKSIKASFDASYALRQGFKVLTKDISDKSIAKVKGETLPASSWKKSMEESWKVWKQIRDKDTMSKIFNEHRASLVSKSNFQELVDNGLAVGVVEDWFPTTLGEKIPVIGNIFKASNEAFTVFSQQARYSLANEMYQKQIVLNGGKQLNKEQLKSITQLANSITGRGSLGKFEASSGALNKLFFSARFIRSQADTFIMPFNQKVTPEIRAEATKHLIGTLGTIGAMIATASAFTEVEIDPRSSNFGKMKVGDNTWVDLTAGLGSYISLATKQATGETKSARTGKVNKLNTGEYGSQTRFDVLSQWAQNKLAPAPSAINTVFLKGENFKGEKPTVGEVATSLGVPITLENMVELMQEEEGATIVGAWVADVLGMSSTTFK